MPVFNEYQALDIMAFSKDEQDSVFRIIAGILHLGNIKFDSAYGEGSAVNDKDALSKASDALQVSFITS